MVLSGTAAMLLMVFSLLMQSRVRTQAPVEPVGYAQQIRGLTTYATALLMLALGFFIAGFPTQSTRDAAEATAVAMAVATVQGQLPAGGELAQNTLPLDLTVTPVGFATSETGAFSGPPPTDTPTASPQPEVEDVAADVAVEAESESEDSSETVEDDSAESTPSAPTEEPTPANTATPEPSATPTSTSTPSPTPTATALPTFTPTPIDSGETVGTISTGGSTVWLRRSPGGAEQLVLNNEDIVLVQPGNANQAGLIWKEVKTVDGVTGWVLADFLAIEETP